MPSLNSMDSSFLITKMSLRETLIETGNCVERADVWTQQLLSVSAATQFHKYNMSNIVVIDLSGTLSQ